MKIHLRILALAALLAVVASGCGGGGITRGISGRCMDGQIDFANSCSALCFGHDGVSQYLQDCR